MKKVFTLAMIVSMAFVGYSQVRSVSKKDALKQSAQERVLTGTENLQHVASNSNMMRSEEGDELDYTAYDWQTNTASRNLTITWPDGCVGVAYTYATDDGMADRGTAISVYHPENDSWTPCGGSIETVKYGFGSAARFRQNGIVVASRNAETGNIGIFIIPDKDNITPNSYEPVSELDATNNVHFPAIMTTGANRDIIHILATGYNSTVGDVLNPLLYFRSMDGGQTWDKENVQLPYLTREYAPQFYSGSDAYFMETTANNRLSIIVNSRRADGMVIYSDDNGETWERKVFYSHPNIDGVFDEESVGYFYPRWVSAFWGENDALHIAYEFGGATGDATSASYYPGLGGVAYWDSEMLYKADGAGHSAIPGNLTPGQTFVMDSAYLYQDIYASLWRWSDATHPMWPEYMGYISPLDADGQPEADPYSATEFNIDDNSLHGKYNCGCCAMPILCTTPGHDFMVAVWAAMDENNTDGTNFLFKLFASSSADGGETWSRQIQLTTGFAFTLSECIYPQAAIVGNKLVVACQIDGQTDSFVIGDGCDTQWDDNCYMGMTYDLTELFGYDGIEEETENIASMSIYPNPVKDMMIVNLNGDSEIIITNMVGQTIMSVNGKSGMNTINISELADGVYFVTAGNTTQKVVVK